MRYYKRYFAGNCHCPPWEYYRIHQDGCYDYWHSGSGWAEPVCNKWSRTITCGIYIEVSKLEVLVVLGVKALGQLSFQEERELEGRSPIYKAAVNLESII